MQNIKEINTKKALLCSDLHLSEDTNEITKSFCIWLKKNCIMNNNQEQPEWLLILGDLFDAWIGDDYLLKNKDSTTLKDLKNVFSKIKKAGTSIGIMHGNRDFLIGQKICKNFYAQPLHSTVRVVRESSSVILLMHGDELCTGDTEHQKFRSIVRTKEWKSSFLKKDIEEREMIAKNMRLTSEKSKSNKLMSLMDIDDLEAEKYLKKNKAEVLIHGHTHQPGKYKLKSGKDRWVIPDWKKINNKIIGGGIKITKNSILNLSV